MASKLIIHQQHGDRRPAGGFRHVAVWVNDPPAGDVVIAHAVAIARAFDGRVTLLRVVGSALENDRPADPLEWDITRQEAREHLEHLARSRATEVPVATEVLEGSTAEVLPLWAERHDVDLTVLCCAGAQSADRAIARSLLEEVPGSVLVVRAPGPGRVVAGQYRRVMVPVDGSPRAESVLPLALRVAADAAAELLIVHVVPDPGLTAVGPLDSEDLELRAHITRRNVRVASEYLDRLRARLSTDEAPLRLVVVRDGDVRTRLERLVRDEAVDLVVMSSHGHSGRTGVPYGSVTADLILGSPVPLLIVRPSNAHVGGHHETETTARLPRRAAP